MATGDTRRAGAGRWTSKGSDVKPADCGESGPGSTVYKYRVGTAMFGDRCEFCKQPWLGASNKAIGRDKKKFEGHLVDILVIMGHTRA